jgi:hypothetical protein
MTEMMVATAIGTVALTAIILAPRFQLMTKDNMGRSSLCGIDRHQAKLSNWCGRRMGANTSHYGKNKAFVRFAIMAFSRLAQVYDT